MEEVQITIIGAGVIGLAIAAELSESYEDIAVVERHETYGQETSSRNSEVIHAGIYYPFGSLKAKLCVSSAEELYTICTDYSIPHKRIGKLIVAADDTEIPSLQYLLEKGIANNVKGLKLLEKADVLKLEPNINAHAAIYSPNTGIIDTHSLMRHFHHKAESSGVMFAFGSEAEHITREDGGYVVELKNQNYIFKSRIVINSAGLASDQIAALVGINIDKYDYRLKFCKGSYFSYGKKSPVQMLVYPVPHEELAGLGVHATLDLGGRLRFGPDVEYVDHIDYKVDASRKEAFYLGATKIIPGLDVNEFVPDMSGIRPKLQGPGQKTRDFIIRDESDKGLPGFINLIGMESPGLTSCPTIAKMVSGIVSDHLA